jgi:ligand-binding sensor domain-containing protein
MKLTWNRVMAVLLTVLLLLLIAETAVSLVHQVSYHYQPSCTYVVLGSDPHPIVKACP